MQCIRAAQADPQARAAGRRGALCLLLRAPGRAAQWGGAGHGTKRMSILSHPVILWCAWCVCAPALGVLLREGARSRANAAQLATLAAAGGRGGGRGMRGARISCPLA